MRTLKWKRATMASLCSVFLLSAGCTAAPTTPGVSPSVAESPTATAISRPGTDECHVTPATPESIPEALREDFEGSFFGQGLLWVAAWWVEEPTLE